MNDIEQNLAHKNPNTKNRYITKNHFCTVLESQLVLPNGQLRFLAVMSIEGSHQQTLSVWW